MIAVRSNGGGKRSSINASTDCRSARPGSDGKSIPIDPPMSQQRMTSAAETVLDFYKQAIPASSVARAIAFAIEQPADVDINEIVLRPTQQVF